MLPLFLTTPKQPPALLVPTRTLLLLLQILEQLLAKSKSPVTRNAGILHKSTPSTHPLPWVCHRNPLLTKRIPQISTSTKRLRHQKRSILLPIYLPKKIPPKQLQPSGGSSLIVFSLPLTSTPSSMISTRRLF